MNLIKSHYNSVIIKDDLKKYGVLSLLYTMVLVFLGPMLILFNIYHNFSVSDVATSQEMHAVTTSEGMIDMIAIGVSVMIALLLFRYIHNTRAYTKLHSFPITRQELYNSHYLSGLILISLPLIINFVIMIVGVNSLNASHLLPHSETLIYYGTLLLVQWMIFSLTVAVNMTTGFSLITLIITLGITILPMALGGILDYFIHFHLDGHVMTGLEGMVLFNSPFMYLDRFVYMTSAIRIMVAVYGCVAYGLGLWLYKQRNLEKSSDFIVFKGAKTIYIILITFVFAAMGTGMFNASSWIYHLKINNVVVYFTLLYVVFLLLSVLIYGGLMMLVNRSRHIKEFVKGFIVYCIGCVLFILVLQLDLTGFTTYIPDKEDIEYASFVEYKSNYPDKHVFSSDELIEKVINLHYRVITEEPEEYSGKRTAISLEYILDNGKTIKREFYIDAQYFDDELRSIYESDELRFNNEIQQLDSSNINGIVVKSITSTMSVPMNAYETVIEALKEDMTQLSYDELSKTKNGFVLRIAVPQEELKIIDKYRSYGTIGGYTTGYNMPYFTVNEVFITEDFVNTLEQLAKVLNVETFYPDAKEISHCIVVPTSDVCYWLDIANVEESVESLEIDYIKIEDIEKIEELIIKSNVAPFLKGEQYSYTLSENDYQVFFILKTGKVSYGCVKESVIDLN